MALAPSEIGRRMRDIRKQLGLSIGDIATACGVDDQTIERLESGTLDPVPGDFILIAARLLKTDFRYFISDALDDVENETRQVFRALADPKPADLLAIRRFMLFCMAESELEQLLGIVPRGLPPRYPLPGSAAKLHKDQGKRAAVQERERLLLGNQPIENIFDLLRGQGVRLCRHGLEDANLSGVTVAHPKAGVCVLVNYVEDLYRQFFSAAHEYSHVLFDRDQINAEGCVVSYRRYSKSDLVEMRANAFAAEFLLPTEAFGKVAKPKSLDEVVVLVGSIAREYRVNTETVAIRMKELKWISEKTLSSFKSVKPVVIHRDEKNDPDIPMGLSAVQAARFEIAAQHGINAYFLELLRRGLTENSITFGRFAEMLDMTIESAQDFVQAVGMAL
jgi:Zn-dependent peptidase ImmA (M78 family)/transcriptional regulator with XRE-family HTH domain